MAGSEPLMVCTDGSQIGHPRNERGYAVVLPDGRAHFGPVGSEFGRCDTELYAIGVALSVTDGDVHIVTDCQTAHHLAKGTRPPVTHEHAVIAAIEHLSAGRAVTYEIRLRDTGPPQHAVAHYLAFRGRLGEVGEGVLLPEASDVLNHPEPYQRAASLVRRALFPAAPEPSQA